MIILDIAKKDFQIILRSKIKLLSLLVVILMPLAYGFLYLWASWDPYSNMKNVPVAIVNDDRGVIYNNKNENFGQNIVDTLKDKDIFKWNYVSRQTADTGLESQKYYAVIIIPSSFSEDVVSASGDKPRHAEISWQTKDSTSYLFTKYFDAVMIKIAKNINQDIANNFQTEAKIQVADLNDKLTQASDGANTLANGLNTLANGGEKLKDNLIIARDGAAELNTGVKELKDKSYDLNTGISKAKDGSADLRDGLQTAATGASTLNNGLSTIYNGSQELHNGIDSAYSGSIQLATGTAAMADKFNTVNELLTPLYPGIQKVENYVSKYNNSSTTLIKIPDYVTTIKTKKNELISGQNQIARGANILSSGLNTLNSGSSKLASGISTAESGANDLSLGINKLSSGSTDLYNGLGELTDGSQKFTLGLGEAYDGSNSLTEGLVKLTAGGQELATRLNSARAGAFTLSSKLASGASEIKLKLSDEKVDKLIEIINEPVIINDISINKNDTYGSALAPYFISLALWMGALMLALIVPNKDLHLTAVNVPKYKIVLGKLFLPIVVGIFQTLLLILAIVSGLGLSVKNLPIFILFCMAASLCFITIMQFLSFMLGKIGELVGVLLMLIQLTSSSGTFPVQSAPRIFQILNPLVPMNYAIKGMRLLILGGSKLIILRQGLVLVVMTLFFVTLQYLHTTITASYNDIYPLIKL